jgi:hypothetical protein
MGRRGYTVQPDKPPLTHDTEEAGEPKTRRGRSNGGGIGQRPGVPLDEVPADEGLPAPLPLHFEDMWTAARNKSHVVKGFMARVENSSIIGPAGSAKSALITDIAVHRAVALPTWRGLRIKGRAGVVYLRSSVPVSSSADSPSIGIAAF